MAHKAVFFNLEPWAEEYLGKNEKLRVAGVEVGFEGQLLDAAHLPASNDFDVAGIFVESKIDPSVIGALPNLKLVAALSTGYDHIDLATCSEKGIAVASVPSYGENTVAEYAFGLILALSRKILASCDRVRDENSFSTDGLRGFDLAGKTLGVVGTGRIGRHLIRMGKGFEMNVVAFDAFPDEAFAKEAGFSYRPLPELLQESDIISLHVPYNPATHHLINKDNVGSIKKGAYLVNTARGAVVETEALIAALKQGQLAGAALDVLEEEGMLKDEWEYVAHSRANAAEMRTVLEEHLLMEMPNVIITPHNAFNTNEAFLRILDTTVDNIVSFVGGAPKNIVKPH